MNYLTHKEARDKLVEAYLNDKIHPYDITSCVCGILNDHKGDWFSCVVTHTALRCHYHNDTQYYSGVELYDMEHALLQHLHEVFKNKTKYDPHVNKVHISKLPNYEDELFIGFCKSLDVLKEIHIRRGENVDEDIPVKRLLTNKLVNHEI